MKRLSSDQRGQTVVFTVISLVVLLGMGAFVLDVGSWFRADRRVQQVADAAALAGAQVLPDDPGRALSLAREYASRNGGPDPSNIAISNVKGPNDTITVEMSDTAPGVLSRMFGISVVDVGARASARASLLGEARWVAPIGVSEDHPAVRGLAWDKPTDIELINLHKPKSGNAAGAFGLIDIAGGNGSVGASELGRWMDEGYSGLMAQGIYNSVPSAMFNSIEFRNALAGRMNKEIMLPVYRNPILGSGSNAKFDIIGWIGFVPTGTSGGGDSAKIQGHFTRVIWDGAESESPTPPRDFGVRIVSLTE